MVCTLSLRNTLWRCASTVLSLIPSAAATALRDPRGEALVAPEGELADGVRVCPSP